MKVQEARRSTGLRVPGTVLELLSELADGTVAVATSSILASIPGASVLSSQNKQPRASPSKTRRILQAREGKLSSEPWEANARCAELERSLELSKTSAAGTRWEPRQTEGRARQSV